MSKSNWLDYVPNIPPPNNPKLIYLAIPYSYNPDESFRIANEVAAILMQDGNLVFSPISHSHHIADNMPDKFRLSYEFWMSKDLPILHRCDELYLVKIGDEGNKLIRESRGCQQEIQTAIECNIPIRYFKYDD